MRSFLFSLILLTPIFGWAQDFYQQSFETEAGYTLSHVYDDGNDDYAERDSAVALLELGYTLTGQDGDFVIAVEDTDGEADLSPTDGVITLTLDAVDISGRSNLELLVSLSCNSGDAAYDERSADNGDYVDFEIAIDGGAWQTIGSFVSAAGGNSTLYHDLDMNGVGGALGELPVGEAMSTFVLPIASTGASAELRATMVMNGSDEVLVLDNFRLRESLGDIIRPQVFSAAILDQNSLEIVFQEPMAASASSTSFYSGVPGLATATLQADMQTVILDYSSDFIVGEAYQLNVFGVQDLAGNSLAGAYAFPFYFNQTLPNLVITEVMYNDPSDDDTLEFVEIYNAGTEAAILGGFRLEDAVNHTLASVTIPAGGFYLAARNALSAEAFYGVDFEDYGGQLSNTAERIMLVNAEGVLIDSVSYIDDIPWPIAADGDGPSMELTDVTTDNAIGINWVASLTAVAPVAGVPVFASPGVLPSASLPVVQFTDDDLAVNEIAGVIELGFFISAPNGQPCQVLIEQVSGTAEDGADHGASTIMSTSLPANSDGTESLAFPLVNDMLDEGLEYFTLRLTAVNNCIIGGISEVTIVIADDDHTEPQLYVNEAQASNSETIADEAGDFDDWVEIFNPNTEAVDIAGYYITDDAANVQKDRIPVGSTETIIPAGGHLILWCDEEGEQGPRHLNFRIGASAAERIVLTHPDGVTRSDSLQMPAVINTDDSYHRVCDGAEATEITMSPTPGSDNCPNSLEELQWNIAVYPNPSQATVQLGQRIYIEVYSASGSLMLADQVERFDVSDWSPGIYLMRTVGYEAYRLIVE